MVRKASSAPARTAGKTRSSAKTAAPSPAARSPVIEFASLPDEASPPDAANLGDENRIRERAYGIWIEEGRPHGRDLAHWRRASEELRAEA